MKIIECFICNKEKRCIKSRVDDKFICNNCCKNRNKINCSVCGKLKIVYKRIDGKPICRECNKGLCSICDKIKSIIGKTTEGNPICHYCYIKNHKEICNICSNYNTVATKINKIPICHSCYRKNHKDICDICNKLKVINTRINNKPICSNCYSKLHQELCIFCNKIKRICTRNKQGRCICHDCYSKNNIDICCMCNKSKKVHIRKEGRPVCQMCYEKLQMKNNYQFRIKKLIRNRIRKYVITPKNIKTKYKINYVKIIEYLGPCPGNINKYHIDHIFPLSAFNLADSIEFQIACSPENHCWLDSIENRKKGAKFNEEELQQFKIDMINKYNLRDNENNENSGDRNSE
jgi:hypothetical protein